MKPKVTGVSICLCVIVASIVGSAIFVRSRLSYNGSYQKRFAVDSGFVVSSDKSVCAVSHYARALQVLRSQGIVCESSDGSQQSNSMVMGSVGDVNEVLALVLEAAKSKDLGIASLKDDAVGICIPDYGETKLSDFITLPKILAQVAKADLSRGRKLDRAFLIGKVNIAVGVQFSAHDNIGAHLVGLICKREGLGILEAYAEIAGAEDLRKSVQRMRTEWEKESGKVKRNLRKDAEKRSWLYWDN